MKKVLALLVLFLIVLLNAAQVEAASARRMPLAYVVHTYGGATRDYQEGELSTWESLTDINCTAVTTTDQDSSGTTLYIASTTPFTGCKLGRSTVSADGQILTINGITAGDSLTVSAISGTIASGTAIKAGFVLECYDDAAPYAEEVQLGDATTNSSYFRVIKAASGHEGRPGVGVRFYDSDTALYSYVFHIDENYSQYHDLYAYFSTNSVNLRFVFATGQSLTDPTFVGCYAVGRGGTNLETGYWIQTATGRCVNCVATDFDGSGSGSANFVTNLTNASEFINCTSRNGKIGYYEWQGGNAGNALNCISDGDTTDFSNVNQTTCTVDDITFDADGYHLNPSDTGAINQGTDYSSTGNYQFDDDIDGNTRSGAWDIGADETATISMIIKTGVSIGRNVLIKT